MSVGRAYRTEKQSNLYNGKDVKETVLYGVKKLHMEIFVGEPAIGSRLEPRISRLRIRIATNSTLVFRFYVLLISDLEDEESVIWQLDTIAWLKILNLLITKYFLSMSCHSNTCSDFLLRGV
jgi:hypothetical protein